MNKWIFISLFLTSFLFAEDEPTMAQISQTFGFNLVQNLQNSGLNLNVEEIIVGMKDAVAKKIAPLTEEQFETALLALQEKSFLQQAETNLNEANQFLTENAKGEGITEIIPGKLQCKVLFEGEGQPVLEHSKPLIQYHGKYVDGTLFGSSEDTPISLPLDETIPGCSMGIVGMKEGGKRVLFVHPDLAYGVTGQLPPNKCLIFEIEVLKADTPKDQET